MQSLVITVDRDIIIKSSFNGFFLKGNAVNNFDQCFALKGSTKVCVNFQLDLAIIYLFKFYL
jgi:hypothetical protein